MIAWMPVMLISTRVHYSIDVLAAPFYAFLADDITLKLVYYSDVFWSLPYFIGNKIKEKICSRPS